MLGGALRMRRADAGSGLGMGTLVAASWSREFSVSRVVTMLVPGAGAAAPVVAATPAAAASFIHQLTSVIGPVAGVLVRFL